MKLRVFTAGLAALALAMSAFAENGKAKGGVRINLDDAAGANAPRAKQAPGSDAGKAATGKKSGKKPAEEPEPRIDGMAIARGDHGFLGVKVDHGTFKISFYDREKKPVVADVARIALRWPVHYQPNPERTVLLPAGDGKTMTSEKVVRPPFTFKLFITLLKDTAPGEDPAAESYVVDFSQ